MALTQDQFREKIEKGRQASNKKFAQTSAFNEKIETKKPDSVEKASQPKMAGSYSINPGDATRSQLPGHKPQKSQINWKNEKKRTKKQKRKRERPPWRK